MRILLIEDDVMIAQALQQALGDAGMSVDWVRDGETGLEAIRNGGHTLILLDLGLPKLDGNAVLAAARKQGMTTPVLVITARDSLESRINGLDLGADDYIIKPFEVSELLARMRVAIRRSAGKASSVIEAGAVSLNLADHRVSYNGITETLPSREFALLTTLVERSGSIFSKSQLEERIYGWGEEVESNAVEVLIYYIRKKFGKDIIINVRGAGWMVQKE